MMVGTDGGIGNDIHREFDELEKADISPLHVLQMTTLNVAEFLGRLDDMGTVEVGKNADLVLLDENRNGYLLLRHFARITLGYRCSISISESN